GSATESGDPCACAIREGGPLMSVSPSPNGSNGRDAGGWFAKGNAGGPGNLRNRTAARLRAALLEAVDDVRCVARLMIEAAKGRGCGGGQGGADALLGQARGGRAVGADQSDGGGASA